jgi:Uma2 family endonuclease
MAETLSESALMVDVPDISQLITEDDTPVDNIFSGIQQRLLVESLYSSWKPARPFMAASNVGLFSTLHEPPIVPDMFLSLDVQPAEDLWAKEHRSYFIWEFGKSPEVVVEIVSNTEGGETDKKFRKYARLGIWYYVIYDPQRLVQEDELRVYESSIGRYVLNHERRLTQVGLLATVWEGIFEGQNARWLRWCDEQGRMLLTGDERAEQERQRSKRLAAQLRALGVEPEE